MGIYTLNVVTDRGYYDSQEILAFEQAGFVVTHLPSSSGHRRRLLALIDAKASPHHLRMTRGDLENDRTRAQAAEQGNTPPVWPSKWRAHQQLKSVPLPGFAFTAPL
jgi:hypothetical protein